MSSCQYPLVKRTKTLLLSTLKFVFKKSRPLSTHLHSPKAMGMCTIAKNKEINIGMLKDRLSHSPSLPHPDTKWPKTFKMPFDTRENSLVAMKAIYKLGITVQDVVNNSCPGLLIPFYEMVVRFLTTKSQHSLKSFGVLFWGVLLLVCHSIAGAHLGATESVFLGGLGCSMGRTHHLPSPSCCCRCVGFPSPTRPYCQRWDTRQLAWLPR